MYILFMVIKGLRFAFVAGRNLLNAEVTNEQPMYELQNLKMVL